MAALSAAQIYKPKGAAHRAWLMLEECTVGS